MLKRNITYEDLEGETVTETFYFNLSKAELMELQMSSEGGFGKLLERIIETTNKKAMIEQFKRIILMSYGVKSEDGKRFIKNDELRHQFTEMPAYSALFFELATDDDAAVAFVQGIVPKDILAEVEKEAAKALPLPVPTTQS